MDAFLGLLISSAVAAIAGTALKGIIRPISWALLAGALLLFGSSKVVEATNSVAESSPSPTETFVATSNNANSNNLDGVPAAALGWQSATNSLNPAFSSLYAQQPTATPLPVNPGATPAPSPAGQNPSPPRSTPAPAPAPVASPRPIQALW